MLALSTSFSRATRASSSKLPLLRSATRSLSTAPQNSSSSTSASSAPANPLETVSADSTQPTHHLITLYRSAIGLPERTKRTLEALGLHKLHRSVLQPMDGPTAGKILAVKELVSVENVTLEDGVREIERRRTGRREGSGVEVVGRYGR